MIDAGEGTYGQMIRYFGEEEAQRMVRFSVYQSVCMYTGVKICAEIKQDYFMACRLILLVAFGFLISMGTIVWDFLQL